MFRHLSRRTNILIRGVVFAVTVVVMFHIGRLSNEKCQEFDKLGTKLQRSDGVTVLPTADFGAADFSTFLEPLPVVNTSAKCSGKAMFSRDAIKQRTCMENYLLLRACPPKGDHGSRPLKNFYLTLSHNSKNVTRFKMVLHQYREANVAFVHLPKAGGTSVEEIFMRIPNLVIRTTALPLRHCQQFYQAAWNTYKQREKTFYYSKRAYGIHYYAYPDRPFIYVTWFRHPVERVVSTYYFLRQHGCFKKHILCKESLLSSRNLTDYLRKTEDGRHPLQDLDNYTVRLLLFEEFPDVMTAFEDCCGSVKDYDSIPAIEEKHYLRAKETLERRMAFIGILEDWKTSQAMLTLMLNIPDNDEVVHVNANAHRNQLSEYELKEIQRRNHWDLKLYADALRIYEKQKEKHLKLREQIYMT